MLEAEIWGFKNLQHGVYGTFHIDIVHTWKEITTWTLETAYKPKDTNT
jgi:hypothetical protein